MGGTVTKEQAISCIQYLELVYSQSSTLYDLIPHAPWSTTDLSRSVTEPTAYGILGLVQAQTTTKSSKKKTQTATPTSQPAPPSKTASFAVASAKFKMVQSTESSRRKKKGKNISKKPNNQ